jgi:hypothetical protein
VPVDHLDTGSARPPDRESQAHESRCRRAKPANPIQLSLRVSLADISRMAAGLGNNVLVGAFADKAR